MAAIAPGVPWDIKASEKSKYDQVFDSLGPMNNMLAGDKVRPVRTGFNALCHETFLLN